MDAKICALLRQTWYETAKKNLKDEERLRFYEMCFEFEFFGNLPDGDAPFPSRLLFDMVRDELQRDKDKAAERSERNRLNGMKGGRPKSNIVEPETENPEKASGLFRNPINNNIKQDTTKPDTECKGEDAHTYFNVCLLFFENGTSEPVEQTRLFWNYYAAQGWKTKGGAQIVDRMALARAWRLPDCSKRRMQERAPYADLMHKANPVEVELLGSYVNMVRDAASKSVCISLASKAAILLLEQKYMQALRAWIPVDDAGKPFELKYNVIAS